MHFIILSYSAGMFGDFIAFEISKNTGFAEFSLQKTSVNSYRINDHISSIIGHDPKTISIGQPWNINSDHIQQLESVYKDKKVVIPTHWFDNDITKTQLPSTGIFLSSNELFRRFTYCLAWIKTYAFGQSNPLKYKNQIENFIKSGHRYKKEFEELLNPEKYFAWKFLAYINMFSLKHDKADLRYFMKQWYHVHSTRCEYNKDTMSKNWFNFDVSQCFIDSRNLSSIENFLNIKLDAQAFENNHVENLKILKKHHNMTLEDLEKDSWLDNLYECYKHLDVS